MRPPSPSPYSLLFSNLVRHSTARVIAAIASIEIPLDHWPSLLPFLQQTCVSPQAAHREVGIYILFTVLESIVEGFETHLQSFFKLFGDLLNDPESAEVRITTVRYVLNVHGRRWTSNVKRSQCSRRHRTVH